MLAERVVRDGGRGGERYLEHGVRGGFDAVISMTHAEAGDREHAK